MVSMCSTSFLVQAMLELRGMTVSLDISEDVTTATNQFLVARDYDVAVGSFGTSDSADNSYGQLVRLFTGDPLQYGCGSPERTAAIDRLRVATTDDARKAAFKTVSEILVKDIPYLHNADLEEVWVHTHKLHGLVLGAQSRVNLDKAWLEK